MSKFKRGRIGIRSKFKWDGNAAKKRKKEGSGGQPTFVKIQSGGGKKKKVARDQPRTMTLGTVITRGSNTPQTTEDQLKDGGEGCRIE